MRAVSWYSELINRKLMIDGFRISKMVSINLEKSLYPSIHDQQQCSLGETGRFKPWDPFSHRNLLSSLENLLTNAHDRPWVDHRWWSGSIVIKTERFNSLQFEHSAQNEKQWRYLKKLYFPIFLHLRSYCWQNLSRRHPKFLVQSHLYSPAWNVVELSKHTLNHFITQSGCKVGKVRRDNYYIRRWQAWIAK